MKTEIGNPITDGLYLVFVPAVVKDWLEPQIVMWHKGEWKHRWSTQPYDKDKIQCWAGPIPVMKAAKYLEYDL